MSIFTAIPAPLRKAARAILPASWVDGTKDYILRHYYTPGFVNRTGPVKGAIQRHVLHKPPQLYRLLYHVTDHCNLNCKGCTHFSNIAEKHLADPEQYRAEVTRLTEVFSGINEIYLLGGEPLLHPKLDEFIRITRSAFPASRINVMTNGVLVSRMPESFWDAMRESGAWLLCDDYPVGATKEDITAVVEAHGVLLEWTDPREEFFKLPIDLSGSQDEAVSFRRCRGVMNCPVLRDGRIYPCAYTAFVDIFIKKFGTEGLEAGESDSISIDRGPLRDLGLSQQPGPVVPTLRLGQQGDVSLGALERHHRRVGLRAVRTPGALDLKGNLSVRTLATTLPRPAGAAS